MSEAYTYALAKRATSEGYCLELIVLFVYHAVAELCKLTAVPTACSTNKVTCDSLELVNVVASAVWTFHKSFLGVLETAVHTSVSVMVD